MFICMHVLDSIPLSRVNTKQEFTEAQQLVSTAREYVVGLSMEMMRQGMCVGLYMYV